MTDLQERIDRVMGLDKILGEAFRNNTQSPMEIGIQIIPEWPEMVSIIKELKFELDEAKFDLEVWQNTDKTSQADIKELQAQLKDKDEVYKSLDETFTAQGKYNDELQAHLSQERAWRSSDNKSLAKEIEDVTAMTKGLCLELMDKVKEINFWKGQCHKEGLLSAEKDAVIEGLRKENEWQDIESAPKRGETLQLYSKDDGVFCGFWSPWIRIGQWCDTDVYPDKWESCYEGQVNVNPTRWRKLPDPPKGL